MGTHEPVYLRPQMAQRDMEARSIDRERPPLSLRGKEDRDKKHQCGKQHDGRTGGKIPVRGDENSTNRAGDPNKDGIPGQRRETMGQLVGGGGRNEDHRKDKDRADSLE